MTPHENHLVNCVHVRRGIHGIDLSLKLLPLREIRSEAISRIIGAIDEAKVVQSLGCVRIDMCCKLVFSRT